MNSEKERKFTCLFDQGEMQEYHERRDKNDSRASILKGKVTVSPPHDKAGNFGKVLSEATRSPSNVDQRILSTKSASRHTSAAVYQQ